MTTNYPNLFGFNWIIIYWAAILLVHAFFAIGVLADAEKQQKLPQRSTVFVGPGMLGAGDFLGRCYCGWHLLAHPSFYAASS